MSGGLSQSGPVAVAMLAAIAASTMDWVGHFI